MFPRHPARVQIQEVAVRDGLQIEPRFLPTAEKIRLLDRLSRTGLAKIEVTSFVSPKAVPNLRDAEEVMRGITRAPGVVYAALVPNARGCERALAAGVDEINLVMSASETHNQANMRMGCASSLEQFGAVTALVRGGPTRVSGTVATAFGCPFEGEVPVSRVLWAVERYLALGMQGIALADTTGMANPHQVSELLSAVQTAFPQAPLTVHFHDTRHMGFANVLAALDAGIERFDSSLGGIGGCPFAPGASGNICTEDLVHMLEAMGVPTGVNLDALLTVARDLPGLLGHEVPGQIIKAGKTTDLHPRPTAA